MNEQVTKQHVVNIIPKLVCGCGTVMKQHPRGYTCFNPQCPHRGSSVVLRIQVSSESAREVS